MKTWLQQILYNTICCLFLLFEYLMWKLLFIDCVAVVFSCCLSTWCDSCCSLIVLLLSFLVVWVPGGKAAVYWLCCCLFFLFEFLAGKLLFIDCVVVAFSFCLSSLRESCCSLIVLLFSFLVVWVPDVKAVVYWLCCCCLFLLFEYLMWNLLFIDCVVVVLSVCLSSW
jgi:hypothetical protein